jgi:hypothetical protein
VKKDMKTNKTIINHILMTVLILIILACFVFVLNGPLQNQSLQNTYFSETQNTNILSQFIAVVVLFFMGFLLLLPFSKTLKTTHMMLLSFIIGLLSFEMICIFLLLTHIYLSLLTIFIGYAVCLALLYIKFFVADKANITFDAIKLTKIFCWSIIILSIGFVFSKLHFSILSFDSVQYKLLGNSFAKEHYLMRYAFYQLGGHTFVPTLLNTISHLFGFQYAYGIQNTFMVSCMALFGYLVFTQTKSAGFKPRKALLLSLIPFLLLSTSFFVVFLSICLVPNMFAGFFMFLLVFYMARYMQTKKSSDIILSFVFTVALCFTRVEGALVVGFILAYVAHKKIDTTVFIKYVLGLLAILLFWYTSFFAHVGISYESDFLTLNKSLLVVGVLVAIIIYSKLKARYFQKHNNLLLTIYMIAVFVFATAISLLDIDKLIANTTSMYLNMFAQGMWIIAWFVIIFFTCIAIIINKKTYRFSEGIIVLYFILLFAIFAFRQTNLHINWSDSGNRLLMHIYPLIIYTIYENIISYFQNDHKRLY